MIKKLKHIITNSKSIVLIDQAVFSGNSFLTTIVLSRLLVPSDFGVYASVILLIYLIVSILNAIVIQPLQVTLATIKHKQNYISFSYFVQMLLIILAVVIMIGVFKLNLSIFKLYNPMCFGISAITIGFLFHDYLRKLFLAKKEVKNAFVIDTLTTLCHFGVLLFIYLLGSISLSQILYFLGLGYIPGILFSMWCIKPRFSEMNLWKSYTQKHYHQSKWLLMTAIVQWWSSNLFVVASGVFLGIKALGAFRLVQSLFGVINILLQTFENYVLPQTSVLLVKSQDKAKAYLKQISLKTAIPFSIVLVLIFVFSEQIIVLAGGAKYSEYAYVVKGMSVLYCFIFLGYPIRMAIRALILNKNFFMGYVLSLGFSLISFNYLLEKWGLIGAIVGLVISQIIVLSYWQFILIKNRFLLWK